MYRLQRLRMGQEEGRLAEQQGGTSRWCIPLNIVPVVRPQIIDVLWSEWKSLQGRADQTLEIIAMLKESEKLRVRKWRGCLCWRIGIWNFPQDDGCIIIWMDDVSMQ